MARTRKTFGVMAALGAGLIPGAGALAALPSYPSHQIQARTNFAGNPGGAFNVPGGYFFSGEDIQLNDSGQVAFKLGVTNGNPFMSLWFGQGGSGGIVYNSPGGAFLSGV